MSTFVSPLSGDVSQPWSWWLNQSLRQLGLINIEQTVSSDPELERRIVTEVAGYGKQLGRMMDALSAVLQHAEGTRFSDEEKRAIRDFKSMADEVAAEKRRYGASTEEMLEKVIADVEKNKDSTGSRALIAKMKAVVQRLDVKSL